MATAIKRTKSQFKDLTIEEAREFQLTGPSTVYFPFVILFIAIIKDFVDVISIGFMGWLGSIIIGFVLWIWIRLKTNILQRLMFRYFIRRFLLALVIGFIPILNFLPEATILVFLVHNREKKLVAFFYDNLERLGVKV